MAIYMHVEGLNGDVTAEGHNGWISVSSVDFKATRFIKTQVGKTVDRHNSVPRFSEVTIYKRLDSGTTNLFQALCENEVMDKIQIDVCGSGKSLDPFVNYTLYDVAVSEHRHIIIDGSIPTEEVKLNYTKMEISYIGNDRTHTSKSPMRIGYDLEKAELL